MSASSKRSRAITVIAAGSALGNAISFGSTAILTRLFTPSEFGAFSLLLAVVFAISTVVAARFDLAVPLPKGRREALTLMRLGALAAATIIGATAVALVANLGGLVGLLPDEAQRWAWAVPVILVPVATFQLLNALAVRDERYGAIAGRNVLVALIAALFQIGAGLVGMGIGGLLGGYFLAQAVGSLALLVGARVQTSDETSAPSTKQTLASYSRFPLLLAPTGLINSLGSQAPLLLVAATFSTQAAGYFAVSQRVLAVPAVLVGQATGQVFVSELAKLHRTSASGMVDVFLAVSKQLTILAAILLVSALVLAPTIFPLMFGESWTTAGRVAQALSLCVAVQLVASPVSTTLMVFDRLGVIAMWDIARLVLVSATILVMSRLGADLIATVWAMSFVLSFLYVVYWMLSWSTVRVGEAALTAGSE